MNGFSVGDLVLSRAVGQKDEFEGVVAEVYFGHYHVMCPLGLLWHRTDLQLTLLRPAT